MKRSHVRAQIRAHELAATRAGTPAKREQHVRAIAHYRRTFKIPEPISFGRDPVCHRQTEAQRAEENYRTGRGPNPTNGKYRNN